MKRWDVSMKKYSILLVRFLVAMAILLSDIMCAVVAYNYCAFQWGGKYEGWSAPPEVAFAAGIPYAVGIAICLVLAWVCHKRK